MGKAFAYFFVGFLSGLILTELTDGKPAQKIDYNRMYFNTKTIYRPYPNYHYYDRHLDTFNNQRPQNNSGGYNRSTGENRSNTQTQTFDHTAQQRTESWGTKN